MRLLLAATAFATLFSTAASAIVPVSSSQTFVFSGSNVPSAGGYVYNPLYVVNLNNASETAAFSGNSGLQTAPSAWGFPTAPDGGAAAFIQSNPGQPSAGACSNTSCSNPPLSVYNVPGSFSVTFNGLTSGQEYTLTFDAMSRPGYGGLPFDVTAGTGPDPIYSTPPSSWTPESLTFFAGVSGSETITFSVANTGYDQSVGIDNLSVSPVPEPSTWAMMLAGLLGLGAMGYVRRNASAKLAA